MSVRCPSTDSRSSPMASPTRACSRRDVIRAAGAAVAAPLVREAAAAPPAGARPQPSRKLVGIQVGAVSFVDEGVDAVLDVVQQRASVNALFLAVFTYGRGIAGRQ